MDFTIGRNSSLTYRPNRRLFGRQLCLPISTTSRKIQAPSCSRLPTLPRPRTRWQARCLLRPSPRYKSPAPRGIDAVAHQGRDELILARGGRLHLLDRGPVLIVYGSTTGREHVERGGGD